MVWRRHCPAVFAALWLRQDKFAQTTKSCGGKETARPLSQGRAPWSTLATLSRGESPDPFLDRLLLGLICIGIQGVYGKLINHCQVEMIK